MELHQLTHRGTQKDYVHFEAWDNAFKQLAFMYLLVVFVLFVCLVCHRSIIGLFCFCIAPYFIFLCQDISLKEHKLEHWFTLFVNFRDQSDYHRLLCKSTGLFANGLEGGFVNIHGKADIYILLWHFEAFCFLIRPKSWFFYLSQGSFIIRV